MGVKLQRIAPVPVHILFKHHLPKSNFPAEERKGLRTRNRSHCSFAGQLERPQLFIRVHHAPL